MQEGLQLVHSTLIGINLHSRISIGAARKIFSAFDLVHLMALVAPDKIERVRNFHRSTLHALQKLVQVASLQHLSELSAHHIVGRVSDNEVRLLSNLIMQSRPSRCWAT